MSKDIATLGQRLLINAANAGDEKITAEMLSLYAQMETTAGQAVQAASILRKLSPSSQLYAAQSVVSDLEKTIQKNDKGLKITIAPNLLEKFSQQTDQAGRDKVLEEIYQNVADQIPATWKDKWNAWRYLAMLANPRTHIRNIAGNVFFQPIRMAKDRVAAAIEFSISAASGGKLQRTKSFSASPELYKAAWADWSSVKDVLSGNKYDDVRSEINSRRKIFRTKLLESIRTGNSWLLEAEDSVFKRITYADALAGYLQANGVTADQLRASQGQQKAASSKETVVADTSLFERGILKNFNAARKNLIEFARKNFPSSVVNVETGKEIGISRTGLDKFLSGNILYSKYASGFHIPELIERAHKVSQAENYHEKTASSIPTFEYYDGPIEIDGRLYNAHIRVKNTSVGDKYYGHTVSEVDDIEIERPTRTSSVKNPKVQSEKTGRSTSDSKVPQTGVGVNALPPDLLARARDYAGREALRATYQDRSSFSDKVVQVSKVLGPAGEAVLPFKRTPANILVRGAEYSPAGLAKALTSDLLKVRKGDMTGAEAIDHIASGLTGTGLFALGALLFSLGIVTGGGGDDENKDSLNDLTGKQNYVLNLPDGNHVASDWLAPEALPFFMGAELVDAMGQTGNTADRSSAAEKLFE